MANIYANRIKKSEVPEGAIYYLGVNTSNGKTAIIISFGHLSHNGEFQVFAATQGRWLMNVNGVIEITKPVTADYYYLCD